MIVGFHARKGPIIGARASKDSGTTPLNSPRHGGEPVRPEIIDSCWWWWWCGGPSSRDQAAVYKVDKSPGCQSDLARAGAQLSLPVKMFSSLISGPGQTHCRLLGTKAIKTSNISHFQIFSTQKYFL